jgi:hypothetical protein
MNHQNPLLAQYHPSDALSALKDQLKAYTKGTAPFDRRVRPEVESTANWWAAVQKDADGAILGVSNLDYTVSDLSLSSHIDAIGPRTQDILGDSGLNGRRAHDVNNHLAQFTASQLAGCRNTSRPHQDTSVAPLQAQGTFNKPLPVEFLS